jgi:hypothetical protein
MKRGKNSLVSLASPRVRVVTTTRGTMYVAPRAMIVDRHWDASDLPTTSKPRKPVIQMKPKLTSIEYIVWLAQSESRKFFPKL